jgi:hypothetical protein
VLEANTALSDPRFRPAPRAGVGLELATLLDRTMVESAAAAGIDFCNG